jgi:hypothetical protein
MRKLFYGGSAVLVGDLTSKAVLRLSRALAIAGKSDIIAFPIVDEGGQIVTAHMSVGPSSEFASVPVAGAPAGCDDVEVIAELERLTRELQPRRPVWDEEMTDVPNIDWDSSLS